VGWHSACRASTVTLQQSHHFQGKPQRNDSVSSCTSTCDVPSLLLVLRVVVLLVSHQATAYYLPLAVSLHTKCQCLKASMHDLQTLASVGAVSVTRHIIARRSQHTLVLQGFIFRASPGIQKGFHPKPPPLRSCYTTRCQTGQGLC